MNEVTIQCRYKEKSAKVVLRWENTPFVCVPHYEGAGEVLGIYALMLETRAGYHIHPPSMFNIETHLNTAHASSANFEGFSYTIAPAFALTEYLAPADKMTDRVY